MSTTGHVVVTRDIISNYKPWTCLKLAADIMETECDFTSR